METPDTEKMQNDGSQLNYQNPFQLPLPNSTAVLVLGIISIVGCWCLGIPGLTLGIIALVLAKNANRLYFQEPGKYTVSSYNNLNAGKVCAIIGTALSGLYIILFIIKIILVGATLGALFSGFPWSHFNN